MTKHDEPPWWVTFFQGDWGDLQEAGFFPPERTTAEVDFLVECLELSPGAQVLDIPCGEGRHSIELASRGMNVCGVDFRERAISLARDRAAERRVDVDFRQADMRLFAEDGPFDAAFCLWGSFGYFDDSDNEQVARNVAGLLKQGGHFLIETHVVETLFPRFRERDWSWFGEDPNRARILEERKWNLEEGRIESVWTFVRDSVVTSSRSSIRIYTCQELINLLERAGFSECRAFETMTGKPFQIGSKRLSLVARK